MVEKTNQAIKAVAEEGNFTYIFDISAGMVLYYDKGEDILPKVKAKLAIPVIHGRAHGRPSPPREG
ncbi:MAG: OmpH family outer membrane protein [Flavobacteriales bacterium]|nr:OmpH family outer membrane protein [Flavobacteriales bacterium]